MASNLTTTGTPAVAVYCQHEVRNPTFGFDVVLGTGMPASASVARGCSGGARLDRGPYESSACSAVVASREPPRQDGRMLVALQTFKAF